MGINHERWYQLSEVQVLETELETLTPREKKKIYEAQVVSFMLQTIGQIDGDVRLYLPDERYDIIPDVRIIHLRNRQVQEIEVVTFEQHSKEEGLFQFLFRTKLSGLYAYPEDTTILCSIEMPLENPAKTAQQMSLALQNEPFVYQIYPDYLEFSFDQIN